jgi:cytochrome c-type biogenesis protein CcmH
MIAFWICAVLLLLLALALVLPAVLKGKSKPEKTGDGATQANLSVLRSQLAQLDADFAAGSINADQLALAKSEIERRALEEESASESALAAQPAKSTRTAIFVGLAIPLLALGIYGFLGNINALDPANLQAKADADPTPAQIEAMVTQFAERLESQPKDQAPDPKAWEMLARSYAAMQKFPEASKAYKRAVELNPGNAQILADHADVLAMLQGQSMVGEPTKLFERALVLDPNNIKALALAGSAAFEKKDFAKAVQFWEKASQLAPPGSEFAKGLTSSVEEARAASGLAAAPQSVAKSAPTPAVARASLQGVVSLSPALKSKVAPDDTVFIFARAAPSPDSPRMPLAILKRKASELPITFTLDDSTAMSDALKLSRFELVVVGARVSKSGNALPQSGDLIGQTGPVTTAAGQLAITIESIQP